MAKYMTPVDVFIFQLDAEFARAKATTGGFWSVILRL